MSDVYVYEINLPNGINEAVTPGYEDDYTIYIDAGLSYQKKLDAYRHALRHCSGDFERADVEEIEYENHQNETGLHDRHRNRSG